MKIAHESPNSIFDQIQKLTDYDYALVHLFEESIFYLNHFERARDIGREIILDNSIFELGKAFDSGKFVYWVNRIQPEWYIIPDSLENTSETVGNYYRFTKKYYGLPGKKIGVIQGKTYEELCDCYKALLDLGVDKVGISFDYSFYNSILPDMPKLQGWMYGRQVFLDNLMGERFFDNKKPLHLLGCSLPQEFTYYRGLDIIDSVDTSNPVVHGLYKEAYKPYGLDDKLSTKLYTLIDSEPDDEQIECIKQNIESFKRLCNG